MEAIYLFLGFACAIIIGYAVWFIAERVYNYIHVSKKGHSFKFFILAVLLSVLFLQIALYCNAELPASEKTSTIISNTLQYFTLDASYIQIVTDAVSITPQWVGTVYIVLAIIFSVIAPFSAGFFIVSIVYDYVPRVQLFLLSFTKRTRYVFSELNERTIETAESIIRKQVYYRTHKQEKNELKVDDNEWSYLNSCAIIFCDAYTDKEVESSVELLNRAKAIGAVCIKDDVISLKLKWRWFIKKKVVYFLMDQNEEGNINTALALLSDKKNLWKRTILKTPSMSGADKNEKIVPAIKLKHWRSDKAEFYVFSRSGESNAILEEAWNNNKKNKENGNNAEVWDGVTLKVFNEYRNLVYRLVDGFESERIIEDDEKTVKRVYDSFPLYWSLLPEAGNPRQLESLNIVIIGSGRIAKEFFKVAYWCGQLLSYKNERDYKQVELNITVIAKNANAAKKQWQFEMPGVISEANKHCLHFYDAQFYSDTQSSEDASEDNAAEFQNVMNSHCKNADYVLVALGNDDLNVQSAHWIKRWFEIAELSSDSDGDKCVPINYVIEDKELCEQLKKTNAQSGRYILNPFGSLAERFDYDNIVMSKFERRAWDVDRAHGNPNTKSEFINNSYSRNSSIASELHLPYKLASLGVLKERKLLDSSKNLEEINDVKYVNPIYWLEHLRWNAYMGTEGWRCPTAKEFIKYVFKGKVGEITKKNHRDQMHKLHASILSSGIEINEQLNLAKYKRNAGFIKTVEDKLGDKNIDSLEKFLRAILPDEYDDLDRLSVLISSFLKDEEVANFKSYDIAVVRNLYMNDLRRQILGSIAKGSFDIKQNNYSLSEAIYSLKKGYNQAKSAIDTEHHFFEKDKMSFIRIGLWKKFGIAAVICDDNNLYKFPKSEFKRRDCTQIASFNIGKLNDDKRYILELKSAAGDSKATYALIVLPLKKEAYFGDEVKEKCHKIKFEQDNNYELILKVSGPKELKDENVQPQAD